MFKSFQISRFPNKRSGIIQSFTQVQLRKSRQEYINITASFHFGLPTFATQPRSIHNPIRSNMKYAVVALLVCAGTLATGRVLPGSFNDDNLRLERFDSLTNVSLAHGVTAGPPAGPTPLPAPASDELWSKCKCKGEMLLRGMAATDAEAGQLLTPPRDSARSEFNDWPGKQRLV